MENEFLRTVHMRRGSDDDLVTGSLQDSVRSKK